MFKRYLRPVLGFLVAAVVCYLLMELIIGLAKDNLEPREKHTEGTDYGLLALSIGLSLVWLFVCTFIHLVMHELGHLIAGMLTGYRFLSFRVLKFTLVKTDEGLRWKRYHIPGTGGQCLLELPEGMKEEEIPWFWYNAGGVLMNLLLVAMAFFFLRMSQHGLFGFSFLLMMIIIGLYILLTNGIPMVIGGISNDGHNLLTLWRQPGMRKFFAHTLQIAGLLSRGKRVGEVPREWIEDIPVSVKSTYLEIGNRVNYMSLLEDLGRYVEARMVGEELIGLGKALPQIFRMEVGGELVMMELMTAKRSAVVDRLWTTALQRYTLLNSKFSPIKLAVLYTYELLYRRDREKANTYREQLEKYQHDFMMPGEARTALSLVGAADSRYSESLQAELPPVEVEGAV